jgi:hypothetical protein
LQSYKITIIIFLGLLLSLISIHSQTHNAVENVIAEQQSLLSTNTTQPSSIVNDNSSEEQNKSKIIKAFGHFANNQINDGIVTWIQGGFWELTINNITNNDNNNNNLNSNNNILINNNSHQTDFIANFTMVKPDGSLSHNHNIKNFISDKVIVTDKDIVVMGIADIYSNDSNTISEYKNVPLTIHLMGKKVLGLTMDVSKTEGHFASPNEMFGTLISGVGLDTSSSATVIDNSTQKTMMMHNDTSTNDIIEEDSMAMMQH